MAMEILYNKLYIGVAETGETTRTDWVPGPSKNGGASNLPKLSDLAAPVVWLPWTAKSGRPHVVENKYGVTYDFGGPGFISGSSDCLQALGKFGRG